MRSSRLAHSLAAVACFLCANDSRADRLRFAVDPVRSTLTVGAATGLTFAAGGGLFGMGSRVIPAQAPGAGAGATLPNGNPSDGLTTSIEGFFVAELDPGPTTIRFIPGASRLELGTSGSWLPGPPLAPATPTAGDLALEFDDATFAWGTQLVLREAQGSFESPAAVGLAAAGAGQWTFTAGCSSGCPAFRVSDALLDANADRLGTARTGLRRPDLVPNVAGTQGQLRSLGDGRYEATIPVSLVITLDAVELHDPLTQSLDISLAGQIVAVPEPDKIFQVIVALATFALLATRGVRRRKATSGERRREVALALVLAGFVEVGGCPGPPTPAVAPDETQVVATCDSQDLNVTKNGGSPVSNPNPSPDCNPDNFNNGFIGEGAEQKTFVLSTDAFLFANGLSGNGRCGVTVDLSGPPAPNVMELDQRCFQSIVVPAVAGGAASLLFRAVPLGLGAAAGDATPSGSVTVTPPGGSPVGIPINGTGTIVPIAPAGGTIAVQIVATSTRTLGGQGYQGIFTQWLFRSGGCSNNYQCLVSDPLHPFCGDGACHDGGPGQPCDDASSCDYDGQRQICDEASGTCQSAAHVENEP